MGTRRNFVQKGGIVQSSATCGGQRQWCLGSFEHIVPSHTWQNDVKASVNNAWQISPLCQILLVRAFVLDGTNGYHDKLPAQRQINTMPSKTWRKGATHTIRQGGCQNPTSRAGKNLNKNHHMSSPEARVMAVTTQTHVLRSRVW